MIITFTNVIGAIRNAFSVVRSGLKMWLGFETSVANQEQVVDGDFPTGTTAWNLTRSSISNNTAIIETTTGQLTSISQSVFAIGRTYLISLDIADLVGEVEVNTTGGTSVGVFITTNGTKSFYFTPAGTDIEIKRKFGETNVYATISNVSVKEVTQITPDKSGNNNVGELFTGKALEFDGSTTYVSANSFAGTLSTGDAFTFAIWFNSEKTLPARYFGNILISSGGGASQSTNIFKIGPNPRDTNDTKQGSITIEVGGIYFDDSNGYNNVVPSDGGVNYNDGQWHRLVVARRQGSGNKDLSFYVDGSLIGTAPCNPLWDDMTVFDFGQEWDPYGSGFKTSDHFEGKMSDIQVYDYAWTSDDVTYDYANPNKLAIDNPSTSLSVTNLKGYWVLSSASISDNKCTMTSVGGALTYFYQTGLSLTQNKSYKISFKATRISGDTNLAFSSFGSTNVTNSPTISQSGEYSFDFTPSSTVLNFGLKRVTGNSGAVWEIENFSVREVTASDHGALLFGTDYVDAQPRIPQLGMMNWSKGSNLFPYSEDFTQWNVSSGGTITPNFALAPNGTQTATKYNIDGNFRVFLYTLNLSTSTEYTFSFYAKNISSTVAAYRVYDDTNEENVLVTSYLSELSTTDWTRIDVTFNTTSTGTSYNLYLMSGQGTGDILFWGAQLEESSSASAYRLTDGGATLNSTVIPNPSIPTQDIFGNAVRDRLNSFNLDGSGYAEVADDADLDFGTGDFTLECWVKYDFLYQGSSFNVIVSNGNISSSGGSGFSLASKSSSFSIRLNAGSAQTVDFGSGLTKGQWYHIVFTRSSTTFKVYLDKSLTTKTKAIVDVDTSLPVRIGRDTNTDRFYQNLISDVRLYDRALTSDEVENNYNAGLSAHTN